MLGRSGHALTLIGLFLFAAGACSGPPDVPECHGQIQMAAVPGTPPVFNWTPECMVAYLVVEDRGDGTGYWSVSSPPGEHIIQPPVTYGVVPEGAIQDHGPNPLEAGGAYRVIAFLVRRDQAGNLTPERIGDAPFNQ